MPSRGWKFLGTAAVALLLAGPLSPDAFAGTAAQRISQIAQAYVDAGHDATASSANIADGTQRPIDRAAQAFASHVVVAIAEDPANREEIVAAAIEAAPHYEDAIRQSVADAYGPIESEAQIAASDPTQESLEAEGLDSEVLEEGDFSDLYADASDEAAELDDPLEPVNRFFFAINDFADTIVVRPLAAVYGVITPDPAKDALANAFDNLNETVVFANELLQFEGEAAAITVGRFLINSTLGVAGLFDVASEFGLEKQTADFGQTLYKWGVGPGPYLVLPLLGPSSARHGVGRGVDTLFRPTTYLLGFEEGAALTGGSILVIREQLIEPLDQLRLGSLDYYSALRSAYYQNRLRTIREEQGADDFNVNADFDNIE